MLDVRVSTLISQLKVMEPEDEIVAMVVHRDTVIVATKHGRIFQIDILNWR